MKHPIADVGLVMTVATGAFGNGSLACSGIEPGGSQRAPQSGCGEPGLFLTLEIDHPLSGPSIS